MLKLSEQNMRDNCLPNCAKIATGFMACVSCLVLIMWGAWATWGVFPYSLMASGVVFCPALMLCIVATLGLWKGKMFGWITGVLGSAVISLVSFFTAGPLCIFPAVSLIFLLTPKVRGFYLQDYYE
jgi:hypothetical protein